MLTMSGSLTKHTQYLDDEVYAWVWLTLNWLL